MIYSRLSPGGTRKHATPHQIDFPGRFLHNEAGMFANCAREKSTSGREGGQEDKGILNSK